MVLGGYPRTDKEFNTLAVWLFGWFRKPTGKDPDAAVHRAAELFRQMAKEPGESRDGKFNRICTTLREEGHELPDDIRHATENLLKRPRSRKRT